jgi:hypothetical protein
VGPERFAGLGAAEYLSFERGGRRLPLAPCDSDLRVSRDVLTQVHRAPDEHRLAWGSVPNRLASAASPYLLQHALNPVDWWEWGPDAFDEARRRDVPLLLSVGYSSCHWCHVTGTRLGMD